jgi:hypothetical protein
MKRGDRRAIEVMRAGKLKQVEGWLGSEAMTFIAYEPPPNEE